MNAWPPPTPAPANSPSAPSAAPNCSTSPPPSPNSCKTPPCTPASAIFTSPHTTAGIIINEAADPDVAADIEAALARLVPQNAGYRHAEGNSDSHIKTALVGTSATIFISEGQLELGRWQGIFFCEFDGPRTRVLRVKIVPD